uniref:FHA domain-containing protein n=1 Tax=viral metagenome TaxID=1070528 RepID=A0A6C0FDJ5_9ZZZZ|tara:strand:- start:7282 stop:9468 length:2187 start_codon:yes stop_codon:yes gene_type:complete
MSIEDIDYLKHNSFTESYMCFVDSKFRDKLKWPTPQEYELKFSTPFRNVYSVSIIDASIPRTQYNIDVDNNRLYYCLGNDENFDYIEIPIGDYDDERLIEVINQSFVDTTYNNTGENVSIKISNLSENPEERSTFKFTCNLPFKFDMLQSTIAQVLGFDMPVQNSDISDDLYGDDSNNFIFTNTNNDESTTYDVINQSSDNDIIEMLNSNQVLRFHFNVHLDHSYRRIHSIKIEIDEIYENGERVNPVPLSNYEQNRNDAKSYAEFYLYYNENSGTIDNPIYQYVLNGNLKYIEALNDEQENSFYLYFEYSDSNKPGIFLEGQHLLFIRSSYNLSVKLVAADANQEMYIQHVNGIITPTPTNTVSQQSTPSITSTPTNTISQPTPSITSTPTNTVLQPTPSITSTPTNTILQPTPSTTPTSTNTITQPTPSTTPTSTNTITQPIPTFTPSATTTFTESVTETLSATPTVATMTMTIPNQTPTQTHIPARPSPTTTLTEPSPTYTAPSPTTTITEPSPTYTAPTPTESVTQTITQGTPTLYFPQQEPHLFPDESNIAGNPLEANANLSQLKRINGGNYVPAIHIKSMEPLYQIIAPGLYSLIGDRYVLLRCPEIEEHMYRSRSFERYTMGIAKFNLATQGYDENRLDYSGLPPREFHPIGKLSTMTLRFERPNGNFYNFRGINHTLTIVIKYYEPKQTKPFTNYTLNSHYNPNYFEYVQNHESESDEEI